MNKNTCELKDLLYKKVVIKVGTNVLTDDFGYLNPEAIKNLVKQIAELKFSGVKVLLVSSGAIGAGKSIFGDHKKIANRIVANQLLASIGQVKMINTYAELFQKENLICSQILVTKEDFRDRTHYLNLRNCLELAWSHQVIPILNENDAVAINTITFTDNDELAGLVASMLNAEAVLILTSVDGLYDGDPANPNSNLITEVNTDNLDWSEFISPNKTSLGRGGMSTKCKVAKKNSSLGITTHFLNGKKENILIDLMEKKEPKNTKFLPKKNISNRKKWLANTSGFEKGEIIIDNGAKEALLDQESNSKSLLPIGIVKLKQNFQKGDIIKILDLEGNILGYGLAQYNSDIARKVIGKSKQKPLVRSEYLFMEE